MRTMMNRVNTWYYSVVPVIWLVPGAIYLSLLVFYSMMDTILPYGWVNAVDKNPVAPYLLKGSEPFSSKNHSDGITVVTAYFNLGTFRKGQFNTFSTNTYYAWMINYGYVNNTVILFTDLPDLAIKFKIRRSRFPEYMTKIYLVRQEEFWAFQLKSVIQDIFDQPGYPKHYPNTVLPSYSCAMHVKYDLIEKVIKEGLLTTKYLAWIDVGYFRENHQHVFTLHPPKDIKDDHISFTQIRTFYNITPKTIIYDNLVWIAGGLFVGRPEYLLLFVEDYKKMVLEMIDMKLMSTDQQVLYCMYTPRTSFQPRVPIGKYYSVNRMWWFQLGDVCKEKSAIKQRQKESLNKLVTTNLYL